VNRTKARPEPRTARVRWRGLEPGMQAALLLAVEDLERLWERSFGPGTFASGDQAPAAGPGGLEILAWSGAPPGEAQELARGGLQEDRPIPREGFLLDIVSNGEGNFAALRAPDLLGIQYAVYALAEHYLGARFLHPFFDMLPEEPPAARETRVAEEPGMRLRIFYETSHTADDLRATTRRISHFSDVGAWRWEDWAGNPERVRHMISWAVKNRANTVVFDDTIFVQTRDLSPFVVSDEIWRLMDVRGLKTFMFIGPSWGQRPGASFTADDFCTHEGPRVGGWVPGMDVTSKEFWSSPADVTRLWSRHLCMEKEGFWRDQEGWLAMVAPHAHRLVGLTTNWNENPCGEGAVDASGADLHPLSDDLRPSRIVEPALSSGSGCRTCGGITNVEKWNRLLDWLNGPAGAAAHGLPPVGNSRTHWSIASPDDELIAKAVIPHLPSGSYSPIYCLPNCNGAERVESWPRLADAANAADGGSRGILLVRELNYGCQGDFPVAHISSLRRIDDDVRVFGAYKSTASVVGGSYVMHSLGWLLTLYSMRKQRDSRGTWQARVVELLGTLMGEKHARILVRVAEEVLDVQMLEGEEPGEYAGYYSLWGLNVNKLALSHLPADGPLRAVTIDGRPKTVRLVAPGARDGNRLYGVRAATAVRRRAVRLLAVLARANRRLDTLESYLARRRERRFWLEHVVQPLRWTMQLLASRLNVARASAVYVLAREAQPRGPQVHELLLEGRACTRAALDLQDDYVRARPGFGADYPQDVCADTLRILAAEWDALEREPARLAERDVCEFLDAAERAHEARPRA
jgi:hypothetical protein